MSLITTIIDGLKPNPSSGLGGANEGYIQGFQDDIINGVAGGVADKTGGQCLVTQNSPLGMSVLVADGVVYIPNADYIANLATATKYYRVVIKAEDPVTIPSNTSGSDCQHGLDVVVDKVTVPNEYASNIATLVVTLGTPGAGAPAVPDNGYRLAEVEVVDGATQIANASITDSRTQITIDTDVLPSTTVYTTATQTLTNKTLTSPVLTTPKITTSINDANGNEVIKTPATTSAVNEVTVTNSATGNAVQVSATGGDTNIDLKLVPKGTGALLDKNGEALSPNYSMSRQAIINGNFDVWQRGTSLAVNGIVIIADRWKMYTNSSGMANTFSQADASDLSGSQYAAKWQRTAGQTGTTNFLLGTSLETKDSIKFRGKKVTLSFYAKAGANYSAASGYLVSTIYTGTGTDGEVIAGFTGSAVAKTQNNVLTTSWQKFTLTTTNVIAASVNQIGIRFDDTPVGTAGADDSFYITQVQLCAGDVALPFQPKSYTQELIDCQRYTVDMLGGSALANIIVATGECNSTTRVYSSIQFPVTMRVAPTLVAGTASNFSVGYWTGGNIALTAMSLNIATPQMVLMNFDVAAGLTANYPARIFRPGTDEKLLFTAEL